MTTHSLEAVGAFFRAAEDARLEAAVYDLRREDGQLSAKLLERDVLTTLEERGVDIRFLDVYR